jgi:hypothetical protein
MFGVCCILLNEFSQVKGVFLSNIYIISYVVMI